MAAVFDPENVERFGNEGEMEHPIRCVNELDYDQLLALYRNCICGWHKVAEALKTAATNENKA